MNSRIKTIALIFLMGICFSGCGLMGLKPQAKIVYPADQKAKKQVVWPDNHLKLLFGHYWALRFEGEVNKNFELEAPYFQTIVTKEYYKNIFSGAKQNKLIEVVVQKITPKTEHFFEFACLLRFKTMNGKILEKFTLDRWISVRGEWYHVIKDPLFFPI